ncbi:MAG TPA: VOC family protein [Myxococcota bacterium]
MSKLTAHNAIATVAVKDLAAARKFYEKIGLAVVDAGGGEAITFSCGTSKLIVYRSQFAGSNKATAVNWMVGNEVEAVVAELRAAGVAFEHYDMPGMERHGDVHLAGGFKSAWFKDPDGNILCAMGT